MKYPIDTAAFLEAAEKESGRPLDSNSRKLWEYIVEAQNEAYEAGRRDGFMERFKGTDEVAPPVPNSADDELAAALQEFREEMDKAFDEEGFNTVMDVLGTPPSEMSWGQRIYAIACEAFFQGGLYAILPDDKEDNDD